MFEYPGGLRELEVGEDVVEDPVDVCALVAEDGGSWDCGGNKLVV